MAAEGGLVTIADIDDERGQEVAREIGGNFVRTDVTDFESNKHAVAEAASHGGGLDIVILNAGVTSGLGLGDDFDPQRYRKVMAINLDGVVTGWQPRCQHCRPAAAGTSLPPRAWQALPRLRSIRSTPPTRPPWLAWSDLSVSHRSLKVCEPTRYAQPLPKLESSGRCAKVWSMPGCHCCVEEVVDVYFDVLASGATAECWFVQPGRPSEPFAFRRPWTTRIGRVNRSGSRPADSVRNGTQDQGLSLATMRLRPRCIHTSRPTTCTP